MRERTGRRLIGEASSATPALEREDRLVTEAARAGDVAGGTTDSAFARVVVVYERELHGRALCICRNHDESRDLVQETFVRAWKHFPQLRPDSNLRAWLMTIMVNLYRDAQRRRLRSREVAFEDWHDIAEAAPAPSHPALEPEQVDAAMAQLAPELRGLLTMKAVEGLRYRDIGQRLGIPANTVGTRLRLARKALHQLLAMTQPDGPHD